MEQLTLFFSTISLGNTYKSATLNSIWISNGYVVLSTLSAKIGTSHEYLKLGQHDKLAYYLQNERNIDKVQADKPIPSKSGVYCKCGW